MIAVKPGTRLGPYEVLEMIGAGGMGQVYKARDTRLDRTVAIKVLPPELSGDLHRQRFEREARTIAGLSHRHICTLHDVGDNGGSMFLVMEHLEGETLAQRIARNPIPIDQALSIGAEVAEALAAAHRQGIVHRDLKPGNVMLTKSGVKLLDFGLAKLRSHGEQAAGAHLMSVATRSTPLTSEGTILGTLHYMSPEQLEGRPLDERTDIWSLGAILYEMLTGHRAFEGTSAPSVIAGILSSEPAPIATFQTLAPAALGRVVQKCLAKDPERRWHSASDLGDELRWIAEGLARPDVVNPHSRRGASWQRIGWITVVGVVVLMLAAGAALLDWTAAPPRMYFHASVPFAVNDVALSPDGRMLALVAYSSQANGYILWTHQVGGPQTDPLTGTQGASYPFWSPDGKFIAFFADGKLKKVAASGGQAQVLCDANNGRGGSWSKDGVILFTPDAIGNGVFRVSAQGGSPVEITRPDTSKLEQSHRWPQFLPDGRQFLFLAANFAGNAESNAIYLGSLDSKATRRVVGTSANASYAVPGYLVYLLGLKTLVAQRFDPRTASLSGDPQVLSEEVLFFPAVNRAVFSLSGAGVLATQTGKGASVSRFSWFDRTGRMISTVGGVEQYNNVRLSPDGGRIAADQTDAEGRNVDIFIYDAGRAARSRLTLDPGLDQTPTWSPNGKQILYASNRRANRQMGFDLFLKNADASGPEQQVANLGSMVQVGVWDWSNDGRFVLVRKGNELWYLTWSDRSAKPLVQAVYSIRNAQFSPDGKWIAYSSNETGSAEVYVSPFPAATSKWQVSTAGGREPKWGRDGKELFYLSPDGQMMALPLKTLEGFTFGTPVALFQTHPRQPISAADVFSYDVSADGQRFLVLAKENEAMAAPLAILLNWAADLDR